MAGSNDRASSRSTQSFISSTIFAPESSATVPSNGLATAALTTYSIVTTTEFGINPSNGFTTTLVTTTAVTDPGIYSSLESAASKSTLLTTTQVSNSSNASSTSSASTSNKSSSNLSTIIPAVVVPVVLILVVTFAAFWFFMRRRHRRELNNQPAFIMAAKMEKLTSTTNSVSSSYQKHSPPTDTKAAATTFSHATEKPLPSTRTRETSRTSSNLSSGPPPSHSRSSDGVPRTSNIRDEQRPGAMLPPPRTDSSSPGARHIASFATSNSPKSNYSPQAIRSANPHLMSGPQTPHNSMAPVPKNISGRGPPPGVGTSNHVLARNRSVSLSAPRSAGGQRPKPNAKDSYDNDASPTQRPPTAPTSGFRNPPPPRSFSPATLQQPRSFSPMGRRAPPPPPIKAISAKKSGEFLNQPQYSPIVRDAPKPRRPSVSVPQLPDRAISYSSHTSPLLPSPHSDLRRDHDLTAENLQIARLANNTHGGADSPTPDNVSEISEPYEEAEEEADVKSVVSSLNELERFDFERDTRGSGRGSALGSQPGARSGSAMNNDSPILGTGHERPWS